MGVQGFYGASGSREGFRALGLRDCRVYGFFRALAFLGFRV